MGILSWNLGKGRGEVNSGRPTPNFKKNLFINLLGVKVGKVAKIVIKYGDFMDNLY